MNQAALTPQKIASLCDHTFLKRPEEFLKEKESGVSPIRKREEALYRFFEETAQSPIAPYAICVRAEDIAKAKAELSLPVASVAGFPHGNAIPSHFKYLETEFALEQGAEEIDAVMNYDALIRGDTTAVINEIQMLCRIVHSARAKLKWILETSELSSGQIAEACRIAADAGVDFIKTSSGYSSHGATKEALRTIKEHFSGGIKISGGVNGANMYELLQAAGVTSLDPSKIRIGESRLLEELALLSRP